MVTQVPIPDADLQPAPILPTKRGLELVMLAFATIVVTMAQVLVELNQKNEVTRSLLYYGAAYLALFAVAHVAVRLLAPYADPLILPCVALLNGLGLVFIHRLDLAAKAAAGSVRDPASAGNAPYQIAWTALAVGLFVAVLVLVRDHRTLARYGYTCGLVGLVALALPGLLPGAISEVNGAKIWLRFGGLGIQPGEFAKILLLIFVAAFLVTKRDLFTTAGRRVLGMELPRARDLAPLLMAWGLSLGVLVLEKDLGSSLLFFGIVLVLIYVATERIAWLVIGLIFFVGGAMVANMLFAHIQDRVTAWLDPFSDYDGAGYQMAQSLFGLGTGGMFGTGLGAGRPDLVPEARTDFITAAIGEELGFVGLSAVLFTYLLIVMRGMRTALAVRDTFGKLVAAGLSFAVGLQVFIVVGGVTKLIPLTGLTAPFLSYGGSSLLANYILVALLLRISHAARAPAAWSAPRKPATPLAQAHTEMVQRP
ncbi:MAG TPA: FtsW/RodA/SpoVE family cell cycle protein [Pseudonocardiaceae bacterium]|jgi:cell division protein FtsW (lipid II flippase)|nr:FtsW/RodA/SpoVE family cell cycle protein [Pseudonocardiaceae bacterium]